MAEKGWHSRQGSAESKEGLDLIFTGLLDSLHLQNLNCRWDRTERWDVARVLETELFAHFESMHQLGSAYPRIQGTAARLFESQPGGALIKEGRTPHAMPLGEAYETLTLGPCPIAAAEVGRGSGATTGEVQAPLQNTGLGFEQTLGTSTSDLQLSIGNLLTPTHLLPASLTLCAPHP